jgi:hypothetical protein
MEVDHLVPESLGDDATWPATCDTLALSDDFDLNGLGNLVPACSRCNGDKSNRPFRAARLAIDLGAVEQRLPEVEERVGILTRANKRERARTAVLVAISEGAMDWGQLREFERADAVDRGAFHALMDGFASDVQPVEVSRDDIEDHLDRPVIAEPLRENGLELSHQSGETRVVRTLREYRQAIADHYFASSSFAMAMEALYFCRPLTLLNLVSVARYPELSYMTSPHLGLCDLDRLPATLLFVIEEMTYDEAFADQQAALAGFSIQDLVGRGEARVQAVSSMYLRVDYAGSTTFLMELMRADTNEDGIEELVVHRATGPNDGTYRAARILALAITAAGENFGEVPLYAPEAELVVR